MIIYKVDILMELKKAGYNTNTLRKYKLLSEGTIQHLRRGEMVGIKSLDSLCKLLKVQPADIIAYADCYTQKSAINT